MPVSGGSRLRGSKAAVLWFAGVWEYPALTPAGTLSLRYLPLRLHRILDAPLVNWCLVALAIFVACDLLPDPGRLDASLGDTDDATRLVQVRELMAGASWYDVVLTRLGGAEPLVSHWSRLVDLPIALLISIFSVIVDPADAETAARFVWPLVVFLPLLYLLARAAEERGGRIAALVALALAIACFSGSVQFAPGRIDHHNVQILAAVGGVLLLARAFANPRAGMLAGALLGLGVAVGYEALVFTALSLACAGLFAVVTGRGNVGIARAAVAFACVVAAAFLLTTAPAAWGTSQCDALSMNLVLLASISSAGLAVVLTAARRMPLAVRLASLAVCGGLGLALYGLAEPACLSGPFAHVDPAVIPVWLGHVSETQSVIWLWQILPITATAFLVHIGLGAVAALHIARTDRDDSARYATLAFLLSLALSLWQIKLMPYAALLAVPPLAVAISRLRGSREISAPTLQFGALAFLNQKALLVFVAVAIGASDPATQNFAEQNAATRNCLATSTVAPLGDLPPGLAVADVDLGPYIVALTGLDVLAGPYHRLDKAILATHAIHYADPADAERKLRATGAKYVVTCPALSSTKVEGTPSGTALRPALLAGRVPAFLEPLQLRAHTPLLVWRLRPPA